jgi:hypothetical protein
VVDLPDFLMADGTKELLNIFMPINLTSVTDKSFGLLSTFANHWSTEIKTIILDF